MCASRVAQSTISNLIRSRIRLSGPIPVADYMKMALASQPETTNLVRRKDITGGYYMKKDVFGQEGDFITSPEISQMFGEMLAVWGLQTWMQIGGPKKFSIVELGPGRGTLSKDILRVFKRFEHITGGNVSLHLVEISPYLAGVQCAHLTSSSSHAEKVERNVGAANNAHSPPDFQMLDPFKETSPERPFYHNAVAAETGFPIYWYRDVKDLPQDFHLFIAHEFFDALPFHKFQKDGTDWREVLVDLDPEKESAFRFVVSRNETPVLKVLQQSYATILEDSRQHIEVSMDGLMILENLVKRLNVCGGIAKIIDYGHDGTKEDTFRGFYQHKLHDPLVDPGKADLTCDVDFSHMRKVLESHLMICGPVTQADFLNRVGIEHRLQALLDKCDSPQDKENLISGYKMIMEDMGSRFHAMTLLPKVLEKCMKDFKVAGYTVQPN